VSIPRAPEVSKCTCLSIRLPPPGEERSSVAPALRAVPFFESLQHRHQCGERLGEPIDRMDAGEGAARSPLAERSAHRVDDDGVTSQPPPPETLAGFSSGTMSTHGAERIPAAPSMGMNTTPATIQRVVDLTLERWSRGGPTATQRWGPPVPSDAGRSHRDSRLDVYAWMTMSIHATILACQGGGW
jgi:hypothetical protein